MRGASGPARSWRLAAGGWRPRAVFRAPFSARGKIVIVYSEQTSTSYEYIVPRIAPQAARRSRRRRRRRLPAATKDPCIASMVAAVGKASINKATTSVKPREKRWAAFFRSGEVRSGEVEVHPRPGHPRPVFLGACRPTSYRPRARPSSLARS